MFTDVPSWPSPLLPRMSLFAIKFQLGVHVCASVAGVLLSGTLLCQSLGGMVVFTVSVALDHCFHFIHAVLEMGTSFRYILEDSVWGGQNQVLGVWGVASRGADGEMRLQPHSRKQ